VDFTQLHHAVIVQFSGVARSRYLKFSTCILHIVNIDFELN